MTNKKLWLGILALVLVFGMTVVGCDIGTTRGTIEYNKFTINGETYELETGLVIHFANYYSDSSINVDLILSTEDGDLIIVFYMFVPNGNDRLLAGTYNLSQDPDYPQFTYSYGVVEFPDFNLLVTGGAVTVSVSGSGDSAVYTITIDCTLVDEDDEDAGTLKGTFRGTLLWDDGV